MKKVAKASFFMAQVMLLALSMEYVVFLKRETEIARFDCMMNRYHR